MSNRFGFRMGIGGLLALLWAFPGFAAGAFSETVERDWVLQEEMRYAGKGEMTTALDAAGGCDGIKDGKWGFHTENSDRPWWQVDLGAVTAIGRVVVWNRCEAGIAGRTANLLVLASDDGKNWRQVYQHDGRVFFGFSDGKPLEVRLEGVRGRFLRIQLPGQSYLHLDEVEVFGAEEPAKNLALGRPAEQSSVSQWSNGSGTATIDFRGRAGKILINCEQLLKERGEQGMDIAAWRGRYERILSKHSLVSVGDEENKVYLAARWLQRELTLADPLLNFGQILFVKRIPGVYSHMSDQHYGWWSRPGGGVYLLRNWQDEPQVECISGAFTQAGSFQEPALSYDGTRVVFAWCRYYPNLAAEEDKLNKKNVPEDAFYHLFEMKLDRSELRQLTRGKYDDFDGRYLPDGRIVFLSTRRGAWLQVTPETAQRSLERVDEPDCYVRCGGGPQRPVAVYTLHTMDADGENLNPISPFEMFEWTPSVAADGTILYSRWDYIDRDNMPYMSLWSMNPDGTHARLIYKNYTRVPHCTFEPQSIPGSSKILFTASGHHAQTMGSLVMLNPAAGTEGTAPITRLTPEVVFPEIEGWSGHYFTNPQPLSERTILVCWGPEETVREGTQRVTNGMGLYVFDAATGNLELLYRDPQISCATPLAVRQRPQPPALASAVNWNGPREGRLLLTDVYRGLKTVNRGDIKALRIVAVVPKTHPTMDYPSMGMTRDDTGKMVLGTVPVEDDGSAFFRLPAGVIVFFQALDGRGMAVQTMRSVTYVQPGLTQSCVGCHESRIESPERKPAIASRREASKITAGPEGSWPYRFDRMIQPVLDRSCVNCHAANAKDPAAARFVLTAEKAYDSMTRYGSPSLYDHVWERYRQGRSIEGAGAAAQSALLEKTLDAKVHPDLKLDADSLERLIVWMDVMAQKMGSFDSQQEQYLAGLRDQWAEMLIERQPAAKPVAQQ